jgi:hypothetical protein
MQETVILLCSLIISATIGGMTGWFVMEQHDHGKPTEIFNV